jgi:NADPH:quinone reductase-like Zn-dependent oxidoreductase
MRAIQFARYGGPDVLELVEASEPHAADGQIRIRVHAAGVNAMDWKLRTGQMQEMMPLSLPSGTGVDASGVVDEVGPGVRDVKTGDAVFGIGTGTFAEFAVLTSWALKPGSLSFEQAAGFPIPVETAIRILDQVGVQPGHTLLVSGASGGVGSAVIQIAKDRGIRVIGTAGPGNQDYLTSIGATATTYGPGLVDRVRALAPDGIDAALDIAGSGVIPELVELTGDPTKVLSIADFSAPEHGAQVSGTASEPAAALAQAARLWDTGALDIPVERTFALAEASSAQAVSEEGHAAGRLIVKLP